MARNAHPEDRRVLELLQGAQRGPGDPDVELTQLLTDPPLNSEAAIEALLIELVRHEVSN